MKEKKTKKVHAAKKNVSRIKAFCDALLSKNEGSIKGLVAASNRRYVSQGGGDNVKEASTVCGFGLKVLQGMGILSLEGENYRLKTE